MAATVHRFKHCDTEEFVYRGRDDDVSPVKESTVLGKILGIAVMDDPFRITLECAVEFREAAGQSVPPQE
jgi:hypothetical protein